MPNFAARWRARLVEIPPLHVLLLVAATVVFVLRARAELPFIADDAFISLRYARRLLDGHGLTWTDGPRVEGYSNLLWVLGCALLGWLGVDLVTAARGLGMAATVATLSVLAWWTRGQRWVVCLLALATFALTGPVAVWSIGGLEQPLLDLCIALGFATACSLLPPKDGASSAPRPILAGVCFGLAALCRPDGLLFGLSVAAVVLFGERPTAARVRLALRFAAPMLGMVLAQLAFRLLYYGDFVPNTGRAKLAISPAHIVAGWSHVAQGLLAHRSIFVVAAAGAGVAWRYGNRHRVLLIGAPLVVWLGYLALVGGDIFPAWRHFLPALLMCAFLIAEGAAAALARGARAQWVVVIVAVNALFLGIFDSQRDPRLALARIERWEWNGEVVGRLLAQAFGAKAPLLAVDAAGCVPYFSGLPSLDMLGLNDAYLGHHPPVDFGETTWLGHELGNGPYVLSRKPDLVLFCLPNGGEKPCFRSGREMVQLDDFSAHYQLVGFEGERPYRLRSQIWVRRDSKKIGIQVSEDRVTIPGYLVGDADSTSRLDAEGRVSTEIAPEAKLALAVPRVPPGRWTAMVDADPKEALQILLDGKVVDLREPVALGNGPSIEVANPGSQAVQLRSIALVREATP
jgi:arabinofuranosyltransferase